MADAKEERKKSAKEMGARVKELREKKELTQRQLATYVGVGQQSIGEIESGQIMDPKCIDKLSSVLGFLRSTLRKTRASPARHKAYRTAMRAFQDDFYAWVGLPLGWKRLKGVKRVSRAAILTRKHEEKIGKKKASEVHRVCTPPLCT